MTEPIESTLTPAPLAAEVVAPKVESREARNVRLSTGWLVALLGAGLVLLAFSAKGVARFAFSEAFDAVKLPEVVLPALPTVLLCGLVAVGVGALYVLNRVPRRRRALVAAAAGLAVTLGFLAWAAAGRDLPFPMTNQLMGTLTLATPLILGALAGILCERSGVVNVAIEGQMLTGAFTAAVVGSLTKSVPAALIAAMIAGVVISTVLALFALRYLVDQVVMGVVINLFASGLTGFLLNQLVKTDPAKFNNAPLMEPLATPGLSQIPVLGPILFQQRLLTYVAVVAVAVVWFALNRTRWGLRVRAVGEHPHAADTVGISVLWTRWSAVLASGLLAGLGGAFFTIGSTGSFSKNITVGYGFIALAALIMGRWKPVGAAFVALFFGFVTQLASQVQTLNTPVPSDFLLMLPYIATIVAVAGLVGRVRPPAADGVPYEKADA